MTADETERDPVEALAAEFMERQRRGERPSIEEYTRRHPQLADAIRDLFPTIAALEGWKLDKLPRTPSSALPETGKLSRVGDFRIIREIGRGGMGIVYEAEQESLGRHVAVKVLPQGPLLGEKQLRRFEREAKTAARLHHTNIVPVFGVGEQDGLRYYVMQYIRGVGLDAVIEAMRTGGDTAKSLTASQQALPDASTRSFSACQAANALRSGAFPQVSKDKSHEEGPSSSNGSAATISSPSQDPPFVASRTESFHGEPSLINGEAAPGENRATAVQHSPLSAQQAPLSKAYWKAVAQLGRQVADALGYAHSQNILHRDIKPANLLLDATGTVWVADFGLAKVLEQDAVTTTGDIVGTLQYMAPEQFQGNYDARSDICGLGLTLYELLSLRPAFQDSNRTRLMHRVTQEEPPPPRQIDPAIPRDLETIVLKASARDPQRRYQTAEALRDDLQRFLEGRPILARRVGYAERLGRWCRRNPTVAGLIALALTLLVAVAVVASVGYVQTRDALEGETRQRQRAESISREETQQRQRAEATASLSLAVLEEIFERLAPDRIVAASQLTVADAGGEEVELSLQPTLSPETAALLEKLLVFYDRLAEQGNNDSKVRRQAAKATRRVGDIRLHLGQTEQALEAYQHAVAMYKELARQFPAEATLTAELAGVYNVLGQALRKSYQLDAAKAAHLTAIEVLTSPSVSDPAPQKISFELARTYFYMGKVSLETPVPPAPKKSGGPPPPRPPGKAEAKQHLNKAVQLLKGLLKDDPSVPAYLHVLALCYREKSTLQGGKSAPIDWTDRKEALGLLRQLVQQFPNVPEYRFDLSETLALMDLRGRGPPGTSKEQDFASKEQDFQEALRLARELVTEHPNVPDYQLSKAQIHYKLAFVQKHNHQVDKAEKNLRQAVDLQKALAQRFPKVPFHQFMKVQFQDALADLLVDQQRWAESRPLLESSIKELKKLASQDKAMIFASFALVHTYGKLAKTLDALGQPELAAQAEHEAKELRQSLPKGSSGFPKERDKKGNQKGN